MINFRKRLERNNKKEKQIVEVANAVLHRHHHQNLILQCTLPVLARVAIPIHHVLALIHRVPASQTVRVTILVIALHVRQKINEKHQPKRKLLRKQRKLLKLLRRKNQRVVHVSIKL